MQAQARKIPIDRHTLTLLNRELKNFTGSEVGGKAARLFTTLLLLLLGISALNVVNSYVGRDFVTSIEQRDMNGFIRLALLYLGVFTASTAVAVFYRYSEESLGLLWREWMTRDFVRQYLRHPVYYRLNDQLIENGEIANPDQRIAEDIRAFTTTTLSFTLMVLNGVITVVAFAGVMWSISPLLFVVAVSYACIGSYLTIRLGRPLIGLNFNQLDKEANLRADLLHVRKHAESIALLRREGRLGARLSQRVDDFVDNFRQIILVNRHLGFFTTGYNYLIQLIPALVTAPMFIHGEVEFGVITQSAMAFTQLLGAFSLIVNQFQSISAFTAVVARLSSLMEAMDQSKSTPSGAIVVRDRAEAEEIAFQGLTLRDPRNIDDWVRELSITVRTGQRLLVLGPSHDAKVALLRATAGIWRHGEGCIDRPEAGEAVFLPERPYMPPGKLREVLVPTRDQSRTTDRQILDILEEIGLSELMKRIGSLDAEHDWDNLLSLGEQQLLAFARLLLVKPRFVFLDRVSTALSPEDVAQMLKLLNRHGITYVTLGHSRSGRRGADDKLDDYDAVLRLDGNGGWEWSQIRDGELVKNDGPA